MPSNQAADSAVGPLGYLTPKTIDKARDGAVVRFKQHRSTPSDVPVFLHAPITNETLGQFKLALEKALTDRGVSVTGRAIDDSVDTAIGILVGN